MASNAFQNAVGIQGQGLQGTPQVQLTQAQVPNFEQSFNVLGNTIKESIKSIKGSERILEYTNMKTELSAIDKEYELVTNTQRSDGTVIDTDGLAVPYTDYTQRYTKRKQDLLQNFDTKYNNPVLFRDDQLWVASKSELQALPRQQEINDLMLERNRLEMKVSEDLGKISANPNLTLKEKAAAGLSALKAAPLSEQQIVEGSQKLILNAVESSVREFEIFKQSVFTKISEQYAEDEQGQAEALLAFGRSDEYRNRLQDIHFDIMDAEELDPRLDSDLEELKAKLQIDDFNTSAKLTANSAEFKKQKAQKQRAILVSETDAVAGILMANPADPLATQHISQLEASKKNATDAEKVVIQDEIDFLKAGKQAFTGMNGSFLNIKVDDIKNVKLKAFVLRQQEVERNAIEAERKAKEKDMSKEYYKLYDSASETGVLSDGKVAKFLREGGTVQEVEEIREVTGALHVDKDRVADALQNMTTDQAYDSLKLGAVKSNSSGERAVMEVVSSSYGLNQSLVNAIFKSSSNMKQALAFSKAYGETGDRLTYKQDKDKASLVYNGEEIRIPSIPLQSNTMLLSNGQLYKMMASMEIQAHPTKSLKELRPGIEKRVNAFIQGSVNKQKEEAVGARTFNLNTQVPFNTQTKNILVSASGSPNAKGDPYTNFSKQNPATVGFVRQLDKRMASLKNTGLTITSLHRTNIKGPQRSRASKETYHEDSSGYAVDVVSSNKNPAVLGRQLHELFVTQANMSNGKPYEIAGRTGGQDGIFLEIALAIKRTGSVPAAYAKQLTADQIRFMIKHVQKANVFEEKTTRPHLHLSGQPDQTNTYKAYNNR